MATYNRTADLTNEAHPLGAGSPPAWYTTMLADGTIVDEGVLNGVNRYRVGTLTGWSHLVVGDYVVYTAASGPTPKYLTTFTKAVFEATYELDTP